MTPISVADRFLRPRMFDFLQANQAVMNGSGSRACGFFTTANCFSEINTGDDIYSRSSLIKDLKRAREEHIQPGPGEELRV